MFKERFSNYIQLLGSMALMAIFLFTACDVNDNEAGTGTMRISLTDAPANYAAVTIEIEQVLVKRADEEEENGDGETEGKGDEELEENGWEVIFNDSISVNLLDYQNGQLLTLGEIDVEAGLYEEIRFVLGDNNTIELQDGTVAELTTPSAQSSGYKLKISSAVEAGEVTDLVIDFDASRSIVATGSGKFILKPVLRTVEADEKATISGRVTPLEANPWIYTVADGDTVSTRPNSSGNFTLYGLEDGTYDVTIEAQAETYAGADTTITGIVLEENENFEFENVIILNATVQ